MIYASGIIASMPPIPKGFNVNRKNKQINTTLKGLNMLYLNVEDITQRLVFTKALYY
jgi:hypothetical protein